MTHQWNYDMSLAPREVSTLRKVGKNIVTVTEAPTIIVGRSDGVVTQSRWSEKRQAWSMFTKDAPPDAWMPWPDAPEAMGNKHGF